MREGMATQIEELDSRMAGVVPDIVTPRAFSPLPVLGVPGWWHANEDARFYDNAAYFREGRRNGLFLNALPDAPGRAVYSAAREFEAPKNHCVS